MLLFIPFMFLNLFGITKTLWCVVTSLVLIRIRISNRIRKNVNKTVSKNQFNDARLTSHSFVHFLMFDVCLICVRSSNSVNNIKFLMTSNKFVLFFRISISIASFSVSLSNIKPSYDNTSKSMLRFLLKHNLTGHYTFYVLEST